MAPTVKTLILASSVTFTGCMLARSGSFETEPSDTSGNGGLFESHTDSAGGSSIVDNEDDAGGAGGHGATGPTIPPNTGGTGSGGSISDDSEGSGGVSPVVWNSWEVTTDTPNPEVVGGTHTATIEFYQAASLTDLSVDAAFEQYHAATHPEGFNDVQAYWALLGSSEGTYPYAGKSTVGRGQDPDESSVPPPLNVADLQLHPPNTDKLVVMAFVAPVAGDYTATNIAVRRVHNQGDNASLVLHAPCNGASLASIQAKNDQAWVVSPNSYALGSMDVGDRICVGVSRDGDYGWDAVEVGWTFTAEP